MCTTGYFLIFSFKQTLGVFSSLNLVDGATITTSNRLLIMQGSFVMLMLLYSFRKPGSRMMSYIYAEVSASKFLCGWGLRYGSRSSYLLTWRDDAPPVSVSRSEATGID